MIMIYMGLILYSVSLWITFAFPNVKHMLTRRNVLLANPVNQDCSSFRGDITEEEAFLWFDEAYVYVRGGSGGVGASTFKYGKSRQHAAVILVKTIIFCSF